MNPQHTAHQHPSEVTVHYRFHPRVGERVAVIRQHSFRGEAAYVVEQRDGSLTHLPVWMTDSAAAAMQLVIAPHWPSKVLLDLRRLIDAAVMSRASATANGGDSEAAKSSASRFVRDDRPAAGDTASNRAGGVRSTRPAGAGNDPRRRSGGA